MQNNKVAPVPLAPGTRKYLNRDNLCQDMSHLFFKLNTLTYHLYSYCSYA